MRGILAASAMAFGSLFATPVFAKTVAIDPAQSTVNWMGKKVTGQHNGRVLVKSGEVEVEGSNLKGGRFEIDMASIVVDDLKDPEYNKKLTNHLKSDDFFGVEQHPVSTFKITSVKAIKGKEAGAHEITGDLTIKGVTKPVTFPAVVAIKGDQASAKGKVIIDRTLFNVRYGSGKFFENLGDKMINDTFELDLDFKSKK